MIMKTKYLVFFMILVVLVLVIFVLAPAYFSKSLFVGEKTIGGERDGFGCLISGGYSYDEEIGACIRTWTLEHINLRKAAKIAVDYLGKEYSLTITSVNFGNCIGCFTVKLTNKDYHRTEIYIKNWEVVE